MQITKQEIKEIYNNWRQAVMVNDVTFLEHLLTDDFTSIRNVGKCKTKADELLSLAAKNVRYLCWEDREMLIDAEGNNGVVKCSQTLNVLLYDMPAKIDREVMLTFVKQDKSWHLQQFKENPVRFTERE